MTEVPSKSGGEVPYLVMIKQMSVRYEELMAKAPQGWTADSQAFLYTYQPSPGAEIRVVFADRNCLGWLEGLAHMAKLLDRAEVLYSHLAPKASD